MAKYGESPMRKTCQTNRAFHLQSSLSFGSGIEIAVSNLPHNGDPHKLREGISILEEDTLMVCGGSYIRIKKESRRK
jgi:hypothetical protein